MFNLTGMGKQDEEGLLAAVTRGEKCKEGSVTFHSESPRLVPCWILGNEF